MAPVPLQMDGTCSYAVPQLVQRAFHEWPIDSGTRSGCHQQIAEGDDVTDGHGFRRMDILVRRELLLLTNAAERKSRTGMSKLRFTMTPVTNV